MTGFAPTCGLNEKEWRVWANGWHRLSDGATRRGTVAAMYIGSTAVRVPADPAWWGSIVLGKAGGGELARKRGNEKLYSAFVA